MEAAEVASSMILLSNSIGISRTEAAVGDGYIPISVIPIANRTSLVAVLKRRLFVSHEVDRFEPVHRTITEFLAATDLSKRILNNSLPIERVMSLICGFDGKPVSLFRGLFAWLMCMLGDIAEYYVERDPYGVATYGDASVLPPSVQCAIWNGLQKLEDPWFLEKQEESNFSYGLVNLNTAYIIKQLFQSPTTGDHLKITIFNAIANSDANIGLEEELRQQVLENYDNVWLRKTALKAYANSVRYKWEYLQRLDYDLMASTSDPNASAVRVELLKLTKKCGDLATRIISIMEQAASRRSRLSVYGYYYPLADLPSDSDLDKILDGTSVVFKPDNVKHFELKSLFQRWLKRRLDNPKSIAPNQLASWLQWVGIDSEHTLTSLKRRFKQEPFLFENVFNLLIKAKPNDRHLVSAFFDLYELLPLAAWPVSPSEFFLKCAEKSSDSEQAASYFSAYLSHFPKENASISLAEAGFSFIERRPDVAKVLGNWHYSEIEEWRKEQWTWENEKKIKNAEMRTKYIEYIAPRIDAIRAGDEERLLAWAAQIYMGLNGIDKEISDPHECLAYLTNNEIADAFIEGFIHYIERPGILSLDEIVKSYCENEIPGTLILMSLSLYLRLTKEMKIPDGAFLQSIALAVTTFFNMPNYNEMLTEWVLNEIKHKPDVVKSVLKCIWKASAKAKESRLPFFDGLDNNSETKQFLAELSVDMINMGIIEDCKIVKQLLSVLLQYDRQVVLAVGKQEIIRNDISEEVHAIWVTALFLIEPGKYLCNWRGLASSSDSVIWEAIEFIEKNYKRGIALRSEQLAEIITLVGKRFPNVGFPIGGFAGSRNPWDASHFVRNQINILATINSPETDALFEKLENNSELISYRDWIRHYRVQYQNKLRESNFTFASPEQVAKAIQNDEPATSEDLLAFVVDHLNTLSLEMVRTQRERYRVYWNHNGLKINRPKHEKICTKLLAEDIQSRVRVKHLIVTVEHHMVADKKCDIVVLHKEKILPIEAKHHYHKDLWKAWRTQLDRLYTREIGTDGFGIYLVLWSGEAEGRKIPTPPKGISRPVNALELKQALESLIPPKDQQRLRVVVVDISGS